MKLVISMTGGAWAGTVYPTQSHRGARQAFSTAEELLRAIALLTGWQSSCDDRSRPVRQEAKAAVGAPPYHQRLVLRATGQCQDP